MIRLVNMDSLSGFFEGPSVAFLKACNKNELYGIADHFGITVKEKLRKDELRNLVLSSLASGSCFPALSPRLL